MEMESNPPWKQIKRQTHCSIRWAQLQKKTKVLVAKVSVVKVTANSAAAVSHNAYCVVTSADYWSLRVLSYCLPFILSLCVCVTSLSLFDSYLGANFSDFGGVCCCFVCTILRIRQRMLKIREKQKKNTETRLVMRAGPELRKKD